MENLENKKNELWIENAKSIFFENTIKMLTPDNPEKKYEWVKDINEKEFFDLCEKKSLTIDEVKQVVLYANKNENGTLRLSLTEITDEQAQYLWDVRSLTIFWITEITLSQAQYLNSASYINLYYKDNIKITPEAYEKLQDAWAIVDIDLLP